jgi:hypothetical protein
MKARCECARRLSDVSAPAAPMTPPIHTGSHRAILIHGACGTDPNADPGLGLAAPRRHVPPHATQPRSGSAGCASVSWDRDGTGRVADGGMLLIAATAWRSPSGDHPRVNEQHAGHADTISIAVQMRQASQNAMKPPLRDLVGPMVPSGVCLRRSMAFGSATAEWWT